MKLSANGAYQDPQKADGFDQYSFMDVPSLARIVRKSDHCPSVFSGEYRRNADFVSCDFLFIDVDGGMSIADFQAHPDFAQCFYIVLTSRSHQKDKKGVVCDRFHVLLPVSQITSEPELAEKLTRLCKLYPFADKSAKGAARFWHGNKDTEIIWHDGKEYTFPPEKFEDDLPDDVPTTRPATPRQLACSRWNGKPDNRKTMMLDALSKLAASGTLAGYQDWIDIGMAMKSEGYDFSDWLMLLQIGKPSDSSTLVDAEYKWKTFNPTAITGGTLMHYARMAVPDLLVKKHQPPMAKVKIAGKIKPNDLPSIDIQMPLDLWREDHCVIKYEKDDEGNDTDKIKDFRVKPTIEQFKILLDYYGIEIKENLMTHKVESIVPGIADGGKAENSAIGRIKTVCVLNNLPIPNSSLDSYLATIAHENKYHPVKDWLDGIEWDGVCRLHQLYKSVKETEDFSATFKETLIRKWFLSCVAAIYEPQYTGRGVLTIQGKQGVGKTSWLRSFFPSVLKCFKDGLTLDPRSKDSISIAISNWVCELGELEGTFKRADIAALKAFITMPADVIRMPYERREETYERRTIFAASVNSSIFLGDQTGTSRFWVIPVDDMDYNHGIDVDQLWAELKTIYMEAKGNGENYIWWLSPADEEMLGILNSNHTEMDEYDEVFHTMFDPIENGCPNHWNITTALKELGYDKPTRFQINKFRDVAIKTGLKKTKIKGNVGYYFPNVKTDYMAKLRENGRW